MAKRKSYKKFYSRSSAAFDLAEPNEVYEPKRLKRVRKVRAEAITKYKLQINKKAKFSFLTYFTIFTVFAGCVITISLNAQMSYLSMQINAKYGELAEAEEENELLRSELLSGYDLSEIERVASTRLGMSRPQSHQIIRVDIRKGDSDSYGEAIYDMPEDTVKKGLFEQVAEFFSVVF